MLFRGLLSYASEMPASVAEEVLHRVLNYDGQDRRKVVFASSFAIHVGNRVW